jgi:hypothetical protein
MNEQKVAEPSVSYVTDRKPTIRDNRGQFVSADPFAQPRKLIEGALRRAAMRSPAVLAKACDAALESAAYGETWQERLANLQFIADRLDGKAVARIETTEGDTRGMNLAELVSLVLQARKSDAVTVNDSTDASDATLLAPNQSITPSE